MTPEQKATAERFQMLIAMVAKRGLVMKKGKDCFATINYKRGGASTSYRCNHEADVYRAMSLMMQQTRRL